MYSDKSGLAHQQKEYFLFSIYIVPAFPSFTSTTNVDHDKSKEDNNSLYIL